ncbi:hypothetical protein COCSADRAFT_358342 [Bipolaris sorokiniana ND90Pr]|uniref:Uncharacterized protein n=1 Tax=Cochliobolus sativus (strain ND90Pr / ATCC 201652) TaxID=665912 RepID=M2T477_COCSN|nr:uncharacterized protein COCSADRAFT_358342 [Bipolaris sorokiniana ND90Pr]EMD63827.1 hypothetical protein COCSADRAFT_358342 [Bipolaris sorokiniana ND90Pr]
MRYKNVSGGWLLAAAASCCLLLAPSPSGHRRAASGAANPTHPKTPPAPALVPNAILFISRRQAKGKLASLARPHLETVQAGRPCWMLLLGLLTEARRGPAAISASGPTARPERRGGGEAWLASLVTEDRWGGVDGARLRSNIRVSLVPRSSLRACTPPRSQASPVSASASAIQT